jgi:hypothetical protein
MSPVGRAGTHARHHRPGLGNVYGILYFVKKSGQKMKNHQEEEASKCHAQRISNIISLILLCGLSSIPAKDLTADEIIVVPPNPTFENIFVEVFGQKGCYFGVLPTNPKTSITGNDIAIEFTEPAPSSSACEPIITPWEASVPIGHLPPGDYKVVVTVKVDDGSSYELGRVSFTVRDRLSVGGSATAVRVKRVICENLTRKKKKKVMVPDNADSWDCEAAGLKVNPGDKVRQTLIGRAVR